jgi:hypothetical protein
MYGFGLIDPVKRMMDRTVLLLRALRQFNRTTPQVSSPQGKNLYATLVLAVFEVAFLVPG